MRTYASGRSLLAGLVLLAVVGLFLVPGTADAKKPAPPPPDDPPATADPAIAFADEGTIYVMNADGSNRTKVVDIPGTPWIPWTSWSADNTRLAFPTRDEYGHSLYVVDVDGTDLTRVTSFLTILGVSWAHGAAPDGNEWIAVLGETDTTSGADVWLVSPAGGTRSNLTNHGHGNIGSGLVWSPDRDCIAVGRWTPTGHQLAILALQVNADGSLGVASDTTVATFAPGTAVFAPDWGRTMDRLVFSASAEDGTIYDLWMVDTTSSSTPTRITSTYDVAERSPVWSEDDTRVVFWRSGSGKERKLDGICSVKPDGTDLVHLGTGWLPSWRK